MSQSKKTPAKGGAAKETAPASAPEQLPDPATIPRPVEEGQVVYLKLRTFFPDSYTPRQMEETIWKLLDAWQKRNPWQAAASGHKNHGKAS